MRNNIAAPLLSLGINLVDTFFFDDDEKVSRKRRLRNLDKRNDVEGLRKEVEDLQQIVSVNTLSPDLKVNYGNTYTIPQEVVQQTKASKWDTITGYLLGGALGFELIFLRPINWAIDSINLTFGKVYPMLPSMSVDHMLFLAGALGITGATSLTKQGLTNKGVSIATNALSSLVNPTNWRK